jgi:hypothetical protein
MENILKVGRYALLVLPHKMTLLPYDMTFLLHDLSKACIEGWVWKPPNLKLFPFTIRL